VREEKKRKEKKRKEKKGGGKTFTEESLLKNNHLNRLRKIHIRMERSKTKKEEKGKKKNSRK